MSRELGYFPPNTGKYKWGSKDLNYSPWVCNFTSQVKDLNNIFIFPFRIICYVDLINDNYFWSVKITDWNYEGTEIRGISASATEAIKTAEKVAEEYYSKLVPDWVLTALKNNWRPGPQAKPNVAKVKKT